MITDLTKRTVMLSGASSGIGAHLARVATVVEMVLNPMLSA